LARSSAYIDELAMIAILLIIFIVLLFAALPTLPYSASGRARYHVVSKAGDGKRPRFSSSEALHNPAEDYTSRFRALQLELQNALDRPTNTSPQRLRLREADRFAHDREQQAA
jgi:hypothetical protein